MGVTWSLSSRFIDNYVAIIDNEKNYSKDYWLSCKSSIRVVPPKEALKWDRENLAFVDIIPANKVYK